MKYNNQPPYNVSQYLFNELKKRHLMFEAELKQQNAFITLEEEQLIYNVCIN